MLAAYQEAKRNFYAAGLRLIAVEGGRFCEAAFRLLEEETTGKFTSLNRQLDTNSLIKMLSDIPNGKAPDAVRIHIPRALRVVYDIRNKRDAAHLADDIDPNLQDATLVVSILGWVLAEFVRLHHQVSASEAQIIVDNLVARRTPAVQDFSGFLKILKPQLQVSQYVLLLLFERGKAGASLDEIRKWVKPSMRRNLARSLDQLVHDKAFVHFDGENYYLTKLGSGEVERQKLHQSV
ncbi:MAG: hypothetical protein WBD95_24390 [Xanthobacteraceae bacterium]